MSLPTVPSSGGLVEATKDERTMALVAHLVTFLGPMGILISGALYMMKKDQSPFIGYHALQAALFQLAVLLLNVVVMMPISMILSAVSFGICSPVICLGFVPMFLAIPWAIKANNGEWAGYPLIGGVGRPPGV